MTVADMPIAEVSESEASPAVKSAYDDIKQTLRVPTVSKLFRVLATNLDLLQLAWRQTKPNAQTVFFEEQADAIRSRAIEMVASFGTPPKSPNPEATSCLRVFHYVDPKLLLIVAALRSSANGQLPRREELPAAAKRQLAGGVPDGASPPAMIDVASADPTLIATFDRIRNVLGTPTLADDYRALAAWPDYLDSVVAGWSPVLARPEYAGLQRDLRRMADETVSMLPFRIEMNPHVLRLCGCTEQQIDDLRSVLESFYRVLPGLVLHLAYLSTGALGPDAARSPFPTTFANTI